MYITYTLLHSIGIMQLHCGTLTAHSEGEGMGSEFRCELPAVLVPNSSLISSDHRQDSQDTMNIRESFNHSPDRQDTMNFGRSSDHPPDRQDTMNLGRSSDHPPDRQDAMHLRGAYGYAPKLLPGVSRLSSHITRYDSTLDSVSEVNDSLLLHNKYDSTTTLHNNHNSRSNISHNNNTKSVKYIMVVDDSGPSRKVLCRLLRNSGYICYEAFDGQDCIEKIITPEDSTHQIDLILMDFEMPRMNGPEATMKLRELNINIPIIGVTGNVLTADKEYFISKGAYSVLHKPISIDDLKENIKKINVKRELLSGKSENIMKYKLNRDGSYLSELEEIELPV